jgi:hypothetical protein
MYVYVSKLNSPWKSVVVVETNKVEFSKLKVIEFNPLFSNVWINRSIYTYKYVRIRLNSVNVSHHLQKKKCFIFRPNISLRYKNYNFICFYINPRCIILIQEFWWEQYQKNVIRLFIHYNKCLFFSITQNNNNHKL